LSHYNLDSIRKAAAQKSIRYGRKVSNDIANLDYTLEDVLDCICKLTEADFEKLFFYSDTKTILDGYRTKYQRKEQPLDELYIKLRLLDDGEIRIDTIYLGSFHLSS